MLNSSPWAVAIIAAREAPDTLKRTVEAAQAASVNMDTLIDVLVNGNPALAREIAAWVAASSDMRPNVQVWSIARGDKAHAWNEYVHRIWARGRTAFFLDGYAQPRPDAFALLAASLAQSPETLGATGVPSSGRTAARSKANMLVNGGFQGNMHAIAASAMETLHTVGFRLPLGLYRTDSLIGALLKFGLDPAANKWSGRRIAVSPDATWDIPGKTTLTLDNLVGQFKRRLRQAQGDIENRAVNDHLSVRKAPIASMPKTARQLALDWLDAHPAEARRLYMKSPLRLYAARKLREPQDWTAAELPPELLVTTAGAAGRAGQ